jgi:hypothetical protein
MLSDYFRGLQFYYRFFREPNQCIKFFYVGRPQCLPNILVLQILI